MKVTKMVAISTKRKQLFKMKKTLQEKLAAHRFKRPSRFIWWLLAKTIIAKILAPKYNPHYKIIDDINKNKGPAFLIYNHQSRIDYVWLAQSTYPTRLNFMVGYNEFFRSHLAFILRLLHVIPKKNFVLDPTAMQGVDTIIREKGGVVCFSPEGMSSITGHNQPVVDGTGKMFKYYGVPVYMVKMKGAFLTNTKVCLDERKGRIDAELSLLFSPDDLKGMSDQEIEDKTNEALWQDDYEWNKAEHIKYETHGNICSHLSDLCYRCPRCGKEFTMVSEKDDIHCSACGNGAEMDDYYAFHPYDEKCIIPESPSKWTDWERSLVIDEIRANPAYEIHEHVKIGKLPKYEYVKKMGTSKLCGEGQFVINHDGVFFSGTKDGKPFQFQLKYTEIPTTGMVLDVTYFSLYYKGEFYDIFPDDPMVWKMVLSIEEMHRLHVNKWKNFPWFSWMYEGKALPKD